MKTLLVIGYGNMAAAILKDNDFIQKRYKIIILGRNYSKAQAFISANAIIGAEALALQSHNKINCQDTDILLCIKPKGLESFIFEGKARCVYSILAGVGVADIAKHINAAHIIRAMPNIAARYKCSATAFYYQHSSTDMLQQEIVPFIESFGIALKVDNETLIESSIATSGSAIAFLALVAESLIDAGVLEGFSHTQSEQLVKQCFLGFAKTLEPTSPSELKYAISSPGGTTIRGLNALEQSGVRGAFIQAAHIAAQYAKDNLNASLHSSDTPPKK